MKNHLVSGSVPQRSDAGIPTAAGAHREISSAGAFNDFIAGVVHPQLILLLPFERLGKDPRCRGKISCFNGAAIFRPRKCWWLPWSRPRQSYFNGAAIFRPRKCLRARSTATRSQHFNGAAIFRPRKWDMEAVLRRIYSDTSMGPRSSDRGNSVISKVQCTLRHCLTSMGPRSSDRGNSAAAMPYNPTVTRLQWGRDLPTAEIRLACRSRLAWQRSSDYFNGAAIFRPRK